MKRHRRGRRVVYGWRYERLEAKIREMLALPLSQRYDAGLVTGDLAERLAENQQRLYGSTASRRLQILQLPPS